VTKVNAGQKVVRIGDLHKSNGGKPSVELTEGEKVQVSVIFEKLSGLQSQLDLVKIGLSELITSIVTARGLDPAHYGVNLAAGKVLLVDPNLGSPVKEPAGE